MQETKQNLFQDPKRTDDIRIEQQDTPMLVIQAAGNCRQMTAGHKFTLQRHFNGDGKYVVLQVSHSAAEADFRGKQSLRGESHYENHIACLPYELPFRPPRVTVKPVDRRIPQTAAWWWDPAAERYSPMTKYGRVKRPQFHWDRAGEVRRRQFVLALRVGTLFAAQHQWGSVFIPPASLAMR